MLSIFRIHLLQPKRMFLRHMLEYSLLEGRSPSLVTENIHHLLIRNGLNEILVKGVLRMNNQLSHKKRRIFRRIVVLNLILSLCVFQVTSASVPVLAATAVPIASAEDTTVIDNCVQPSFTSPLPLLVFDSSKAKDLPNYENNFFTETEILSSDNEATNTLSLVTSVGLKGGVNNLTDRENATDNKHDYFMRFDEETQLLGLPSTREFFVLGGMDDKSLIRNYIGYSMGKEVFADSPDVRLCELIIRDGNEYRYQGVYLLVAPHPAPDDFLLWRGTQGVEMLLETYADLNDNTIGELTIPLRKKSGWDDSYNDVLGKLSWTEEVLYDTSSRSFYQYQEMIDVESFVSGFILGELTENYTGMHNAYYYYNSDKDRVAFAPLWDFEHAFDNEVDRPVSSESMYYTEATYFRQLFKSPSFANQIKTDYLQLRRGALDEQALMELVDDAVVLVSPAVSRDWARWDEYSHVQLQPLTETKIDNETALEIEPFSRQSDNYEDEILRIKTQLREHSLHFAVNVTQFDFQEREISKEIVLNSNPIWIVVFIVAFFIVVNFVRRYGV